MKPSPTLRLNIKLRPLGQRRLVASQAIKRWKEFNPDPKCELYYQTPYQLLVSVVLSAQTTDKMVNRCMEPLYQNGLTPETLLSWGQDGLLKKIRTIGLAPTKSKHVLALTKIIVERYHGDIPLTREGLESLPGVGRKTANVILGEIFKEPTLAVDTHVFRVGKRLGLHAESTPTKAEPKLLECFDRKDLPAAHHWLILHGRYTCKAKSPLCGDCLLADICPSIN